MSGTVRNTFVAITGQINDGVITLGKLATDVPDANKHVGYNGSGVPSALPSGISATLIETLTASGVSSVTSSNSFAGYNQFLIIYDVVGSGSAEVQMQFNGLSAASYSTIYSNNTPAFTNSSGNTSWRLAQLDVTNALESTGWCILGGNPSNKRPFMRPLTGAGMGAVGVLEMTPYYCSYAANIASITSITLLVSAGTMTGKVLIYGIGGL